MAKHIFKCKPHVVYTFFVSTCEWTGSLDDSKITAGVPLKLASWPACLWKLGKDVFFSIGKCRGFHELLPILGWRCSTLDAKIYGNVCLWSVFFLQPRQIPTPTYLLPPFAGTFFIANVETRAIPYVDLGFMRIFLFFYIHIDLVYFFFAHTCCKSPQSCVYRFMCVYHKVCYLLVVFLRCPHSNPESFSQHVGQADGLHHLPACPLCFSSKGHLSL